VNPSRIDIEIAEIVLHGLAASDVDEFQRALHRELTALATHQPTRTGPAESSAAGFGAQVAASVWQGIADATRPGEPS
jgi:hypothetical protein